MDHAEHEAFVNATKSRIDKGANAYEQLAITDQALQEYLDVVEARSIDREDRLETRLLYIVTAVGKACDALAETHKATRDDPLLSKQQQQFHARAVAVLIGITTAIKGVSVRMEKDRHA